MGKIKPIENLYAKDKDSIPKIPTKNVVVKMLDGMTANDLENLISAYITNGYAIQNSDVSWYQGTLLGVCVFVKREMLEKEQDNAK